MRQAWCLLGGLLMVVLLCAPVVLTGCGKQVKETAEAVRLANDAKDGNFTVKGEKGEEVKVETQKAGDTKGTITATDEKGVTTTTEYGKDTVKESDVGIAFYPGATPENAVKVDQAGGDQDKVASVVLVTDDPVAKVVKFYKDKYGKGNQVIEQGDNVVITIQSGKGAGKMIMVSMQEGKTKIMIHAAASQ